MQPWTAFAAPPTVTVTKVVVVSRPHEARPEAEPEAQGGAVDPAQAARPHGRYSVLVYPARLAWMAGVSAYMYLLSPAWSLLSWTARIAILPARFVYLMFLERPLGAALSLFLWVLPLLSFAIAVTLAGIAVGGLFGWASTTLTGLLRDPADYDLPPAHPSLPIRERREISDSEPGKAAAAATTTITTARRRVPAQSQAAAPPASSNSRKQA